MSNSAFATFVKNRGPVIKTDEPDLFVDAMIKASTDERILMYEDSRLEEKYPEITDLVNDFSDDILAFEISELKMWGQRESDTTGLEEFYEANKNDYLSAQSINAKIYTYLVRGGDKALSKAYNKYSRKADGDKLMGNKLNSKNDTLLIIEQGTWELADKPELGGINWERGTKKTTINGYPSIVRITEVNRPRPLPFADVRELILERFIQTIGNRWVEQLKADYPVKVDNSVLENIKNELR